MAERFRILETIDTGSIAVVRKALDESLGRFVAIKTLKPDLFSDSALAKVLEHEASIVAGLVHANLPALLDFRLVGGRPELVFAFVEGATLRDLLKQKNRLDVESACAIAIQILSLLIYLKECGVAHGDLSSTNVLVGKDGVVRVVDFGLATRDGTRPPAQAGAFTPQYASPERWLGGPADSLSDQYALGVLFFEMLSGKWPFESRGTERKEMAVPLRSVAPAVSMELDAYVMQMLQQAPDDRFLDLETARERLGQILRRHSSRAPERVTADLFRAGTRSTATDFRQPAWLRSVRLQLAVGLAFVLSVVAIEMTHKSDSASSNADIRQSHGGLRVLANPWAEVWVDGELRETTPFAMPIAVSEGQHVVTLRHPFAEKDEREVRVLAGHIETIEAQLKIGNAHSGDGGKVDDEPSHDLSRNRTRVKSR